MDQNFTDELIEKYPDGCAELKEEIKCLKRKLDCDKGQTKEKVQKKINGFTCKICSSTFSLKNNYVRHVLAHSSFFNCDICNRKFKRKDYLHKHMKRNHQQEGGRKARETMPSTSSLPSGEMSDNSSITHEEPKDHDDNASYFVEDPINDHNYASRSQQERFHASDHDYVRQQPSTSQDHSYSRSTATNSALNQAVQDITILPNHHEQYDLLTFFANIKSQVERILAARLQQHGIKWYLSVQVEMEKDTTDSQQASQPYFRSRTYSTLNLDVFDEHDLNESFQKMFESFERYIRESSGWVLKKVIKLIVHSITWSPLSGSSFVELPKGLRKSQSLFNIRNLDQKCFLWSCLASLHPSDSPLVSDYEQYENDLIMEGITYPVSVQQISQFEKQNPFISVNVFTYDDDDILPLRITRQQLSTHHVNLLLLQSEERSHYVLIKDFNAFLRKAKKGTNKQHFCHYCLHGFSNEILLQNHVQYCQVHGEQKVELPSNTDCFLEFNDYEKQLRVPYVIYADFETLNKPIHTNQSETRSNTPTQLLEACSFGYKVISTNPDYKKDIVIYRGQDASKKLLECLLRESHEIQQLLDNPKELTLSAEEEISFQTAERCCLCKKKFDISSKPVRHHEHTTGDFIGAAHSNCNLQCKQKKFIPVIFHGLKNFDAHLLCQTIGSFKDKKLSCIPQTMEKYISFSIGNLRFLDSFGFLPSSLENLVDNLAQNGLQSFTHFQNEVKEHTTLLLRKGVYPYEYMNDWSKFNETKLPSKESFFSSVKQESISDEDYEHAKTVFKECNLKHLGEYHDLYLKADVLLLADVFEQFRNMALVQYDLDPCHFYTSPGLSWQAMLKMTGVTLELLTDIDMLLFCEKSVRGGISVISNRFKTANNPQLENYDPKKDTSYLAYFDVNNLYGFSMLEKLPTGFFRFLNQEEIDYFNVHNIPEESSTGYLLEADLEYPDHLHDSHSDYPLAAESKFISNEKLSPYCQRIWKKLHGKKETDALPPRAKVNKLLTTLEDKEKYTLHYKNLQLYLQLGMKVKKIHRILEFKQEAFMKPYVEFNTKMRMQAKTTFEKNFYKLMNNSVFGKTMENLRKHRSIELCHTEKRLKKLSSKSTYKMHRIFSEDLVGVELNRLKVKMNRPIYVGMVILDLSKTVMYDFYYNHLKSVFGDNVQLQFTDTDSFLVHIISDSIYQYMKTYSHLFDTSDFPKDHFLHSEVNRKVLGKMKSETNERIISEFCGLRAKLYAFNCGDIESKRCKGIQRSVVEKQLRLQHYKDVLFNESQMTSEMHLIRSHDHQMYCEKINKIGLSCFDDKRYVLEDGITSLAYGHYKIKTQ